MIRSAVRSLASVFIIVGLLLSHARAAYAIEPPKPALDLSTLAATLDQTGRRALQEAVRYFDVGPFDGWRPAAAGALIGAIGGFLLSTPPFLMASVIGGAVVGGFMIWRAALAVHQAREAEARKGLDREARGIAADAARRRSTAGSSLAPDDLDPYADLNRN